MSMTSNHEILTLQFGNYSNYIGAHWWNNQEAGFNYDSSVKSEINHDVLYREGVNFKGQTTFTPRLLIVDLEGSLKHLSEDGELYSDSVKRGAPEEGNSIKKFKEEVKWSASDIEVVSAPATPKHQFQKDLDDPTIDIQKKEYNLSENVETWADYLYSRYHPRTVNVINEYKYSPDKESFDTFSKGVSIWQTEHFEDEFCDKIRQYVEECDCLQGFQTIFDCYNGYSGLATHCLDYLNDEYAKTNLVVPVFSPKNVIFENADEIMSDSIRVVNSVLAYNQLFKQCSMFVPLSTQDRVWRQMGSQRKIRLLNYKENNLFQTSAILAAYLDLVSLRYRLKDVPGSLSGLCHDLTNRGRKMAAAALSLPFPMRNDEDLIDCLDCYEGSVFTQLSPNCKVGTDFVVQSLCVRGIPDDRLKRPFHEAREQMKMAAYKYDSVSQMFQFYLQCTNHASLAHVTSIGSPLPTKLPFPAEMFDEKLDKNGFVIFEEREENEKVISVPALASVQSSSKIGDTLENLHREAKRIKANKLQRYIDAGMENDEYIEAMEGILQFQDNYDDNWQL